MQIFTSERRNTMITKYQGEMLRLEWDFDVALESEIDRFELRYASDSAPDNAMVLYHPVKEARSITLPGPMSGGGFTYWLMSERGTDLSLPTNKVHVMWLAIPNPGTPPVVVPAPSNLRGS
jgi:hypothetical protein